MSNIVYSMAILVSFIGHFLTFGAAAVRWTQASQYSPP